MTHKAASTLKAEGLKVGFNGRDVLNGVSIAFQPGEVTAIIGPNGAGKSTLIDCLGWLRRPDGGAISLGDHAVGSIPDRERARRIGILPQSPEIAWAVDVETLVGLGRLPYLGPLAGGLGSGDWAVIERAMAQTEVTRFRHRIATTLSGGERGRALLARALAGEPEWLLADEPMTGLDPGHQFDTCDLFRMVAAEGRGVVVTLHDLGLAARLADRVVVLASGVVVADGPPQEALTVNLLAEVYGVEARIVEGADGFSLSLLGRTVARADTHLGG